MSSERLPRSKELGNHISADVSTQALLQPVQRYDFDTELCNSPSRPSSPSLFPNAYRGPSHARRRTHLDLQLDSQTSFLLMKDRRGHF